MRPTLLAAALCAATPALAAEPMSAPEFDAYTQGRTLYYNNHGTAYGVEEYLPGNRVRWSFLDGQCKEGTWYQQERFICFVYEDQPGAPQCWTFWKEPGGMRALFEDDPSATELYEVTDADEPMLCLGPDVGV
ncbi:hypothetical protein [Oceanicola sp. 502str15]|uniref:hypothetical protein n=1 Tax=Oceanicola sp. 502str15 TaxID=2696061 RepID=UPI00209520B6|nr:hypothetical protein [Oceanicola sp. 502str15]MCO6382763.1 hypothetical protein [Oceanicola sp. 502str15]